MGTVVSRAELVEVRQKLRESGKRVIFTNGCFDLLHRGHIEYLTKARALGDVLIVGLNSDGSIQRLKGATRPIISEEDRSVIMAALSVVDYVCVFEEDTPYELIRSVVPDILVKGADWGVDEIVGKDIVEAAGGSIHTIEFLPNRSTTNIIQKIVQGDAPRS
ncbi:MAG: D-glycero-beta-D-manno-heptose 1-phosphate adenylyltransferase [Ignavibacteria bacterium]|nr:D-glycero-beta-D-manno-heptose 1-phosphate adenylyltransferase [Ignavibacteria bacterium]